MTPEEMWEALPRPCTHIDNDGGINFEFIGQKSRIMISVESAPNAHESSWYFVGPGGREMGPLSGIDVYALIRRFIAAEAKEGGDECM